MNYNKKIMAGEGIIQEIKRHCNFDIKNGSKAGSH
jgi:hypothetical protein